MSRRSSSKKHKHKRKHSRSNSTTQTESTEQEQEQPQTAKEAERIVTHDGSLYRIRWKDSEAAFDDWKPREQVEQLWPDLVRTYDDEMGDDHGLGGKGGVKRRREVMFCETVKWWRIVPGNHGSGGRVIGGIGALRG